MKEFDIYLKKRLTECNIIIYNLPFRDGMTVFNRMILNSIMNETVLYKMMAVQTGSELVAEIEDIRKTVQAKLETGMELSATAGFSSQSAFDVESGIDIALDNIDVLETVFSSAFSAMRIAISDVEVFAGKSLGEAESGMIITQDNADTIKQANENVENIVDVISNITDTRKTIYENPEARVDMSAILESLSYQIDAMGEMAMQLAAVIEETDIHFSLGNAYTSLEADVAITDDGIQKTVAAGVITAMQLLSNVTANLIVCLYTPQLPTDILQEVSAGTQRYRKLYEMDTSALNAFEEQTLGELYYVTLEV